MYREGDRAVGRGGRASQRGVWRRDTAPVSGMAGPFFTVQQVPVRFLSVEVLKKLRLSADTGTYFKVLENYYNFTPLLFYYKLIKIKTESAASLFSIIYTGIDSIPNF